MDPKELKAAFEEFKQSQVKADESIRALVKEIETGTKESIKAAKDIAEKAAAQVLSLSDRLVEAEQKLLGSVLAGKQPAKTFGALFVESDEYKAFASGKTGKVRFTVQANTITGQSGSPATNSDTLVPADRRSGIIPGAFRRLRIRDVIPAGPTNSNMIEFTRELAFTNNAAETAENATKPESVLTFELANAPVVTIAHWLKITKQIMEDAPALASYVDTRLRYGVELREETQLIAGNGTGQNMKGITYSGNYTAFTPATGDNALDSLNKAKYAIIGSDYAPNAIIMNPTDWGAIERLKVGSSDDRYVIGDPRGAIGPVLWGLPVIVSNSMTSGKLLVAAFDIAFQIWDRSDTVVEMSESDDTNFQKNLVTVRAEKRLALAAYRPASVRYGNLTL